MKRTQRLSSGTVVPPGHGVTITRQQARLRSRVHGCMAAGDNVLCGAWRTRRDHNQGKLQLANGRVGMSVKEVIQGHLNVLHTG